MDNLKLGQIITAEQHRDAIHIAVAPAEASHDLLPAQHVGIRRDGKAYSADAGDEDAVGIVDPFLTTLVKGGEKAWVFLYPGSITSLRHEWSHPAFEDRCPKGGRAFTALTPEDAWRTADTVALARQYILTEDREVLGKLADALEEAGCEGPFLQRFRYGYADHQGTRLIAILSGGDREESARWVDRFAARIDKTHKQLMEAAETWVEGAEYTYDNSEAYKEVDSDEWAVFWDHYTVLTGKGPNSREDHFYTCSC